MKRLAILGGGSWGTALAIVLAPRFEAVRLWVRREALAREMQTTRENRTYLPGFAIPANVEIASDLCHAMQSAHLLLSAVPSHTVRDLFSTLRNDLPVVSATKGLEEATHLRMTQVIAEATGNPRVAALSGPSFAQEVAAGCPTAVVVASAEGELARAVQEALSGRSLRVYSSTDLTGVELAGAYKNVVAIGAGVCHGLGLGQNAAAALITRGLAEMTRLAVAMGARPQTLSGLSGLGDLVLTCTGALSRNRAVGIGLAAGSDISSMSVVAEGVKTAGSIVALGRNYGVDLPIAEEMDQVIHFGRSPQEAIRRLMERSLREE